MRQQDQKSTHSFFLLDRMLRPDRSTSSSIRDTVLSLGQWGLLFFWIALVGLLFSQKAGRQAFLDEGHATQRRHAAPHSLLLGWLPSHRVVGALLLVWLIYGSIGLLWSTPCDDSIFDTSKNPASTYVYFDVILGLLGITTTWTAMRDFPHKHVRTSKNKHSSGTLSQHSTVTHHEMLEHLFYQVLNLIQTMYLHTTATLLVESKARLRLIALAGVTSPWLLRHKFPVHPFSQNWSLQAQQQQGRLEQFLYRIKKYQYLLYKHVLLHGINVATFLHPQHTSTLIHPYCLSNSSWRLFWICLNASYVLEFFMQSMVKRNAFHQSTMLLLNRYLMVVSTLAAVVVVVWDASLPWFFCVLSLVWNWFHRHHDFAHTMILAMAFQVVEVATPTRLGFQIRDAGLKV